MEENETFYLNIALSCTLHNTRKAARAITELYEAILSPSGVHATQFPLLVAIKHYETISVSELAQGLQTDRTTLTRTLKPLQENGWVAMAPGRDRRVHEVSLTTRGEEVLAKALPLWETAQTHVRGRLGQERWKELIAHLQEVAALQKN